MCALRPVYYTLTSKPKDHEVLLSISISDLYLEPLIFGLGVRVPDLGTHLLVEGLILPASLLVPARQEPNPKARIPGRRYTSLHVRVQDLGLKA